jgi:hypothetical protein
MIGRRAEIFPDLKVCDVCSCQTGVLVHLADQILSATAALNNLENYPKHCWKHSIKP